MRTAMALLVVFLVGAQAQGQGFYDGNQLKRGLDLLNSVGLAERSTDDRLAAHMSFGYVLGAADASVGLACLPANVTQGQITDIVLKYLGDHPDRRHYRAASLVREALLESFPCAKAKAP
jgi:hypothetical protein